MKSNFFVDLHCHPSIKAYARSFQTEPGVQSDDINDPSSIWRRDPPSLFDKLKQYVAGLTNFIQSDTSSLLAGRVCVVCISFYPQEKGFFINKAGEGIVSDALTKLATEFGQERIDFIQQHNSYWEDLKCEMQFLQQMAGRKFSIDGIQATYEIAGSYAEIEMADQAGELGETKIIFIPSIEGGHIFDQVMNAHEPWDEFPEGIHPEKIARTLQRVKELRAGKEGLIRPFFLTLAHHFWNGLCGHERSLGGIVKCVADQENGLGTGFTPTGKLVVRALLDEEKDENGKLIPPVIIDIKHMSRRSREEYFELIKAEFPERNIPLIASHAGVTGLSKPGGIHATLIAQQDLFNEDPINFYDDEILQIESSNGVMGIQLDERRIGSKHALRKARGHINRRDILFAWSKLVWYQVQHIAEVLDAQNRFSWAVQTLGTDFDGIIDPINGFWTAKQIDDLDDYLLIHAYNYLRSDNPLTQERNSNIRPEEVVERIMTGNALNFLSIIAEPY